MKKNWWKNPFWNWFFSLDFLFHCLIMCRWEKIIKCVSIGPSMTLAGSNFNLDLVFFCFFPLSYIEESYAFHDRKVVQICIFPCTVCRAWVGNLKQWVPITSKFSNVKGETQCYVVKLPISACAGQYCPQIPWVPGTHGTRTNSSPGME